MREEPPDLADKEKKVIKEEAPKPVGQTTKFIVSFLLSLMISLIMLALQSEKSFPYLSIAAIVAGIFGIAISV